MNGDTRMRAKVRVGSVIPVHNGEESLAFYGVAKDGAYPEDGSDENNTFARFSPGITINLHLANPALIGEFEPGDTFYIDFIPAPK